MSEAELVSQITEFWDRYWVIVQWCASVSFGVVSIAHFGAERLNLLLISIIVFLYVGFTAWTGNMYYLNVTYAVALESDLQNLEKLGGITSERGAFLAHTSDRISTIIPATVIVGTFLGTLYYLIYVYRKNITRP
jgi:hypothetical protein